MQQFASKPQAVGTRKSKYREPNEHTGMNLMNDTRVIRGSTYASIVEPKRESEAADVHRQRAAQKSRLMRANQTKKRYSTPEPLMGRKHMDIQTDSYMEELTERVVEFEAQAQTDFLLDRPPSPLFMPAVIGVDIDTQIEAGDLFDFDVECEPVLEVLVGKTLEQAMMEVLEEEELESLRRHQEDFEKRRNAELIEVQRMEAAEQRRRNELTRRIEQSKAQKKVDLSILRKVVSRNVAKAHLASLKDRVLMQLSDQGVFASKTQLGVEALFLPNLLQMVKDQMRSHHTEHALVGKVAETIVGTRLVKHDTIIKIEQARLRTIDDAVIKARIEIEEDKQRKALEEKRIRDEEKAMLAWEEIQPPEPIVKLGTIIAGLDQETGAVMLDDGSQAMCDSPEAFEELRALLLDLEQMPEVERGENRVLADFKEGAAPDGEANLVEHFRIGVFGATTDDVIDEPAPADAATD